MTTRSAARCAARWLTCSSPRRLVTVQLTSLSRSPGRYARTAPNSIPSPTARPVCSPMRRSSSGGTSRGLTAGGRGNTSIGPAHACTVVDQIPPRPRQVTRTGPMLRRPHTAGRTVQLAWAVRQSRVTCAAEPVTRLSSAGSSSRKEIASIWPATVAVTVSSISSRSKQRLAEAVALISTSSGRRPCGAAARAASSGAASSSNPACPVTSAAARASSAIVASRRVPREGYQLTWRLTGQARSPPAGHAEPAAAASARSRCPPR